MTIDTAKLKEAFLTEADMYIKNMNNALVKLEGHPDDQKVLHEMFRGVHTLKSLAGTMNYMNTMKLCHTMEDLMTEIRDGKIKMSIAINPLFEAVDTLTDNVKALSEDKNELDVSQLIIKLKHIATHSSAKEHNETRSTNKSETSFSALKAAKALEPIIEKIQTVAVKVERLDMLVNLAEELLVSKLKFDLLKAEINHPDFNPAIESLGRLISDLQYYVLQVRLVPISFIFNRFIRMARDLAKQQNKKIEIQIEGGDIELDRILLDEIGASIAHLIKNAIDHGIESPEIRKKKNKPEVATIRLRASRTKEYAIIEVNDDGSGLDLEAIKEVAQKEKIISPDASDDEIANCIFLGLSTTKKITAISGRGLGMSIVKQKIESIGGTIRVKSVHDKFTSIFIEIPLTLAIIKTLFVKVGTETYAIPTDVVERLLVMPHDQFKWVFNDETIVFHNVDIPLINLANLFEVDATAGSNQPIVIVSKGNRRLGLAVDSLLSTQDIVIKPLSKTIKENKYFSGAAMIGSGKMILILDVGYLLMAQKPKKEAAKQE